ncbi:hypothetical protein EV132_1523 [Rhizobium sullae]|uniref:Uncharacterized protein n=1 Tax=Rhizobium sullae TaxID=50338 RepID=A0A4R3PQT6_RHISU|nr:hypothetical protein EV132_1523 [Rhizobium sullae]
MGDQRLLLNSISFAELNQNFGLSQIFWLTACRPSAEFFGCECWGAQTALFALEKAANAKAEKLVTKGKPLDLEELIRTGAAVRPTCQNSIFRTA